MHRRPREAAAVSRPPRLRSARFASPLCSRTTLTPQAPALLPPLPQVFQQTSRASGTGVGANPGIASDLARRLHQVQGLAAAGKQQ